MRRVISGKPILVVTPQGIQFDALKQLNISLDDLMEGIRSCNYFSIDDCLYVIVENNGSFCVLPKVSAANVTTDDLKLKLPENTLPLILVSGGKIVEANLKLAKISKEFVLNTIKDQNFELNDVLIFTIDTEGAAYIQNNEGQTKNIQVEFKGDW